MYRLSDEEISFILDDVRRNGIEMEDLQLNLLDHISCIIESELEENGDFMQFYSVAVKRFYKKHLSEIEDETKFLLNNKYYYSMRKTMLISGAVSTSLLTLGILFKFMHWPGAGIGLVIGTILFSLLFLPLVFTIKVREKQQARDKALIGIGTLVAALFSLGTLFKIMHWPGANMLGVLSLTAFALIYIPLFFFSGIKNQETKINTIVTCILMISGCGLFLALVRTPQTSRLQSIKNTEGFIRTEKILMAESEQMRGVDTSAGSSLIQLSNTILQECDQLKSGILEWQTGYKNIMADFENKNALIEDDGVKGYFEDNANAQRSLIHLQQQIARYNAALKKQGLMTQFIPDGSVDFFMNERKTLLALTDIVQVQMMVLQNLKAMSAKHNSV
jgi:hypothetical protein